MLGLRPLKPVLPAVTADLHYDALGQMQEGAAAGRACLDVIDPATEAMRRERLIDALLDYCELDTYALLRFARFFQRHTGRSRDQGTVPQRLISWYPATWLPFS